MLLLLRGIPLLFDLLEGRRGSLTRDELLDELSEDRDEALDELKDRLKKGENDAGDSDRER